LLSIFKPAQTALLILTGVLGYLIASMGRVDIALPIVSLSLLLSISGTTGLNMVFDRDIDSLMFRTKNRALPSEQITPDVALVVSATLTTLGILLAAKINPLCGLAVFAGSMIDLLLYTILLKRWTPISVSIGGIAGGMPALAGYTAYSGRVDGLAASLVLIITLWSMAHIWLIASYYIDDYKRANVPMLPVVIGIRRGVGASIVTILLINAVVFGMHWMGYYTSKPFLISLLLSVPSLCFAGKYLRTGRTGYIKKAYLFLSPYLGLMMMLLVWLRIA
ncbi:MAG: protoheme IX farnesyltransferase, partial [Anaerolineae bacterium]|nr:protoheme IX farnesyltransferase [Anaerolineae bacterium]